MKHVVLRKHMCIAMSAEPPKFILVPELDGESEPKADVYTLHYQKVEDQQTQAERQIKVENKEAEKRHIIGETRLAYDRLPTHGDKLTDKTTEFESM